MGKWRVEAASQKQANGAIENENETHNIPKKTVSHYQVWVADKKHSMAFWEIVRNGKCCVDEEAAVTTAQQLLQRLAHTPTLVCPKRAQK